MNRVILGIHGLANKPPADILADWWEKSIREGLKKNTGIDNANFVFESVYWADVMYDEPNLKPENPYKEAGEGELKTYEDSWMDLVRAKVLDWGGDILDTAKKCLGIDRTADAVLEHKLKDLSKYYQDETVRNTLRSRLRDKILENRDNRIMLLAHSMGTIIAYDVLRDMGKHYPRLVIDHFVTLGSPLGLPHVKYKIAQESNYVRTPSIVKRWSNFADKRDPVALDVHLAGDYAPNSDGVRVKDDLIANDWGGLYHHSFGYLRAPEVSKAIRDFI